MTKDKKINKVLKDDPIPDPTPVVVGITSVVVKALDPVYSQYGQLSYGFTVSLDGVDYNFRTNTQGYLELDDSHIFLDNFTLAH